MKAPIFCLACLLLAAPALADVRDVSVPVGPFAVYVEQLTQLGQTIRFRAAVSGGGSCETLELAVFLRNAEASDRTRIAKRVRLYEPGRGVRIDVRAQHERGRLKERRGWYIDNIVIRCVNGGVAARHESNPR